MTTFTVAGSGLATIDGVTLDGPTPVSAAPSSASETSLAFTAVLAAAGVYDLVLTIGGEEVHREVDILTVNPPAPNITAVSPSNPTNNASADITYTVTGTNLSAVAKAGARNATSTGGWTQIPITGKTDTQFQFVGNWGPDSVLDIAALDASNVALDIIESAITVGPDTTPRIDTVSPTSISWGSSKQIVVTGYGLLQVATWRIGTSGVGFDDSTASDYIGTPTDTRIEFWTIPDVCGPGVHDVIGNKSGGTAYIRKDDCITVS